MQTELISESSNILWQLGIAGVFIAVLIVAVLFLWKEYIKTVREFVDITKQYVKNTETFIQALHHIQDLIKQKK